MSQDKNNIIGLIVGREQDWPSAFITAVAARDTGITAELVKVGGTYIDEVCPYPLIIDRMSHEIPYYRAYLKHAAIQGTTVINNPFTWSFDSRFFGDVIIHQSGLPTPRTVVLPNKEIEQDMIPDNFRNLKYPMDWQGIIDFIGVPAILKDVRVGGRRIVYRVNNVDELIHRYDESDTRTMILQQVIESDTHIHGFVIGQEQLLLLQFSLPDGRYLPDSLKEDHPLYGQLSDAALKLTKTYNYDLNMVEFVINNDQFYVINSTNPAPVIDQDLMSDTQFDWCVQQSVDMALSRLKRPLASTQFNFPTPTQPD